MKRITLLLVLIAVLGQASIGQDAEKRSYKATRVQTSPLIDGEFDDDAWTKGEWEGGFTQFQPYDGQPASQETEFKLIFDDSFLYVGIKALDSSPDSIVHRMTRRDDTDGDFVGVSFDSYHDLSTGFTFFVSSTGVKTDIIHANNGMVEDPSWDPIWYVKTSMQEWGWAAEIKIPLTQLRFEKNSSEVWGFEVIRQIYRESELSFWQAIPRTAPGMIHMYGELTGLEELEPKKTLDITPYTVASYEKYEAQAGNPFASGNDFVPNAGIDGKVGVTNNLTLDFTINPDFGQVEADPSEVNLTAYETFFREKRPFFVEGKNITSLSVGIGDGEIGNDNLFYSRRIGRRPSGYAMLENGEYAKTPRNIRILGAAKLTGKTKDGLSVGIIESVTPNTYAQIDSAGNRTSQIVEPLTNYFIGRVQKDFNKGNTRIGGMITNTQRNFNSVEDLESSPLNYLHTSAFTGGIDFSQSFNDRNWNFSMSTAFSQVKGSKEAISATQLSARHMFQRPDATHKDYDPDRTSLSGMGGQMQFGKFGGNWNFMLFSVFRSPGFELNDVGYLRSADEFMNGLWSAYSFNEPKSFYRNIRINSNFWGIWDYGLNFNGMGGNVSMFTEYKNFWVTNIGVNINGSRNSTTILRGGPMMKTPGGIGTNYMLGTDRRKKITARFMGNHFWGYEDYSSSNNLSLDITYKPFNTLNISVEPSVSNRSNDLQYLAFKTAPDGTDRYLFAGITQKVLSMSVRINYNITPNLTIQYWGQPFFAAADYDEFKMITDPIAGEYNDRFHVYDNQQIQLTDGVYFVDENRDGTDDYTFGNPDFNFDEFLSNLVLRWEFVPGSTVYLVWSQSRDAYLPTGDFVLSDNITNLFTKEKPYNVFLVKFSYRFGLN